MPGVTASRIAVTGYRSGGGAVGNVGSAKLTNLRTSIPYVARVENLEAAAGGVDPETVDNLPGLLVSEIVTTELDTLMHPRNDFAMFPPLRRTFGLLRVLALDFGQSLLFLAEKSGILNFGSIRQGSECF